MPRKPRFFLPNIPVHVVIRGNARRVVFAEDADRKAYLGWLKEAAEKYKVDIHAYVLMDNHVHLLLSTNETSHISKVMQHIGRKYVPYFNHKYEKSGTLWEGRFKGCMIESEQYLLCCYRYIELNPVRANRVKRPEEWKWSSYASNGYGEENQLIKPHPLYLAIYKDKEKRVNYYREGFRQVLDASLLDDLRSAVQTGTPLGNNKFKEEAEELLGVKTGYEKEVVLRKVYKRVLTPFLTPFRSFVLFVEYNRLIGLKNIMGFLLILFFSIGFITIIIAAAIEIFELYPTLSEDKGVKVNAGYLLKTRREHLVEYVKICEKKNKSLIFYQYIKYYDKWGKYYLIIFFCIVLLQAFFIFF